MLLSLVAFVLAHCNLKPLTLYSLHIKKNVFIHIFIKYKHIPPKMSKDFTLCNWKSTHKQSHLYINQPSLASDMAAKRIGAESHELCVFKHKEKLYSHLSTDNVVMRRHYDLGTKKEQIQHTQRDNCSTVDVGCKMEHMSNVLYAICKSHLYNLVIMSI